jgi:hypothetical protein
MKDFKSVQDLIIKAAFYDKVTTTISADDFIGGDVLKITFSKDNRHSVASFDLVNKYRDPEEVALYCCKRALYDLLCDPYEEITYKKEN